MGDIITFDCRNWELLRIILVQGGCKLNLMPIYML